MEHVIQPNGVAILCNIRNITGGYGHVQNKLH